MAKKKCTVPPIVRWYWFPCPLECWLDLATCWASRTLRKVCLKLLRLRRKKPCVLHQGLLEYFLLGPSLSNAAATLWEDQAPCAAHAWVLLSNFPAVNTSPQQLPAMRVRHLRCVTGMTAAALATWPQLPGRPQITVSQLSPVNTWNHER